MHELLKKTETLQQAIAKAISQLNIDMAEKSLDSLRSVAAQPDFWADNVKAQSNMKEQVKLENRIKPWRQLQQEIDEVLDLVKMDDNSLMADLEKQIQTIDSSFQELKQQLKFNGLYDDYDAIVSIHAGAGGTDAQDWAQMLLRMYLRWAERHSYKVVVLDESAGEEAGIKSVTFEIEGVNAYGQLKGEHGVHRLVRLSPFNADNLRQTSFAKVEIMPKIDKPTDVIIDDNDLKIDVYRSGGHGGQSVNTTDSAVRVTHLPTGVTVAIQNERSQLQNKETALTLLRSQLAQLKLEQHREHLSELKGPNQSAEWGSQIRSYVLHPYKQVKDLRTKYETSDPDAVLNGDLDPLISAYLEHIIA